MNRMTGTQLRLLTWLDVERLLKQTTHRWADLPDNILAVDCFASGMDIYHNGDESQVDQWLTKAFGRLYLTTGAGRHVELKIGSTGYPVSLIQDAGMQKITPPEYPLWKDVVYLPDPDQASNADEEQLRESPAKPDQTVKTPAEFVGGPELVSFHSFKGGVGRTSALMTYVTACFKESSDGSKKILVVDADLEAPGVTFWLSDINKPSVSFVQLLEALHYPPTNTDEALEYFATELKKTSYSVNGLERELFVLPAALDLSEIQDMSVTPEHLARNPANPWQLTDHLHALGQKLGADAVFIDLRAGLSELASPLLFDPRIDHFFVTTVASQSVLGMAEVLRSLHAYNRRLPEDIQARARPSVVLSLLTKDLRESASYGDAIKRRGRRGVALAGGDEGGQAHRHRQRAARRAERVVGDGRGRAGFLGDAEQSRHQGEFFGVGQAALAGLQRGRHEVAGVGAVFQAQGMAVFVQEDGQQVHLAGGGAAFPGDPQVRVTGGEVFFVQVRGVVEVPAVAGGVGVKGDAVAGGLSNRGTGEISEGEIPAGTDEQSAKLSLSLTDG